MNVYQKTKNDQVYLAQFHKNTRGELSHLSKIMRVNEWHGQAEAKGYNKTCFKGRQSQG